MQSYERHIFPAMNNTYFVTEFVLTGGYYNLHLLAIDDVNQEKMLFLNFINVVINNTASKSSVIVTDSTNSHSANLSSTNSILNPQIKEGDVIELGFVSGVFTGLAALGNAYLRKRRTMNQ